MTMEDEKIIQTPLEILRNDLMDAVLKFESSTGATVSGITPTYVTGSSKRPLFFIIELQDPKS